MFMILSYREKELSLALNTAVVTSFWPRFHSKSDCHAVFHVELENEISRELDEVFTNGERRSSCFRRLFHLRPTFFLGELSL